MRPSAGVSTIAVLGPGGVGGFLAATLARAGEDVTVVASERTAEQIERSGIMVSSVRLGEFTVRVPAHPHLRGAVDVLLVATKATHLDAALGRIHSSPGLVVPLLNGLDHMQRLRERFGPHEVAAGAIRIESQRLEPGRILHTSAFLRVDLASDDPSLQERLQPLARSFERAGVPATIWESEARVLWAKLVRLNALACTTSVADQPIGFIRGDPHWRRVLEACITEAAAVANAEEAQIDPAIPLGELDAAHAQLGSSMQRDLAAGREPELDAIPGAVLRAAGRHGLSCPTIARLHEQIAQRAALAASRG